MVEEKLYGTGSDFLDALPLRPKHVLIIDCGRLLYFNLYVFYDFIMIFILV
jgi:hypothetical protein